MVTGCKFSGKSAGMQENEGIFLFSFSEPMARSAGEDNGNGEDGEDGGNGYNGGNGDNGEDGWSRNGSCGILDAPAHITKRTDGVATESRHGGLGWRGRMSWIGDWGAGWTGWTGRTDGMDGMWKTRK